MFNSANMSKYKVFTKTPCDKKSAVYYTLLAFVSACYVVFFDYVRIDAIAAGPKDAALLAICAAAYCLPLFFILMLSRWVFIFAAPILFYIGAVGNIYTSTYLFDTTTKTAPLFFNNSVIGIISKNTDVGAFLGGMFAIGLAAGFVRFFYAKDVSVIRRGQAFAVIVILAAAATGFVKDSYKEYLPQPYAYINSMKQYINDKIYYTVSKNNRNTPEIVSNGDNVTGIVIFIDRLSNKAKKDLADNMIIQDNFTSNFNNYRFNMLSALTGVGKNNIDDINTKPSLMSVFNKAGFNTLWVTTANKFSIPDPYINSLAKHDSKNYQLKESKGLSNPFLGIGELTKFISENTKGLMILSVEGTPPKISKRYKNIFQTDIKNKKASIEDNYKDYTSQINALVTEIEKRIKNRDSFIVLAGIQGEEISDYNDFIKPNATFPPSILGTWKSDSLHKKLAKKHIDDKFLLQFSNDMLYYILLDYSGIKLKD